EGDNEFTMDEVEVIQNYLLSHAGEDTDVILGLGYDNTLNSEISITLIATGFEHKDPFRKETKEEEKKQDDKIVLQLEMPAKETPKPQPAPTPVNEMQAVLPFAEPEKIVMSLATEQPQPVVEKAEPVVIPTVAE